MKKNIVFTAIVFLHFLIPTYSYAQGIMQGIVIDSTTREPLVGANVFLQGTALGSATDLDGKYRISGIPEGTYSVRLSYLGYITSIVNVQIVDHGTSMLNGSLIPDVIEGNEVIITAQARGQIAAINQQLTSKTIVNVISEEKIKELPDANAAESIGRLPGVSILRSGGEANKVILRGLDAKFTNVTIDGIKIPATDALNRSVDLSMLSQSSLAGIELFKALTPDKDGDALAGSINLVTKKAPDVREVRADIKGNYNKLMNSANQYDFALHYGERFFDNLVGIQLSGNLEKKIRSNERINRSYSNLSQVDWFINDFTLEFTDEIRKRDGFSVLLDFDIPDHGTIKVSNVVGKTKRDYLWSTRDYPSNNGGDNGRPNYIYRDREQDIRTYNSSVRGDNNILGIAFNWGISFAESEANYPYDYQMIFAEPSGMLASPQIQEKPEQLIPYAVNNFANSNLEWAYFRTQDNYDKERTAFLDIAQQYSLSSAISGEFKFGGKYKEKNRSNARSETLTPYYLGRWMTHEISGDSIRPKNFAGTYFEDWFIRGGGQRGTILPLREFLGDNVVSRNIYDSYQLTPLLIRERLRQWRELNKNGVDNTGSEKELWANDLIKYDDYFITERVSAGYIMNTLNLGQLMTIIAGVRIESEDNLYNSTFMTQRALGFPLPDDLIRDTSSTFKQTILLPNINIALKPLDFINVRLAAYKALSRPDFNMRLDRYIAGRPAETTGQFQVYVGNSGLKSAQAWNYEFNTSFFGNTIGLITLSAYYKEIKDMYYMLNNFNTQGDSIIKLFGINWASQMQNTAYNLTLPYNSPKLTKVWGFEFEHQINFKFLPGLLQNIVLSYNASVVRSEAFMYGSEIVTYIDSSGRFPVTRSKVVLVERKQKLEGMPDFFGNIAIGYDIGGFSTRFSVFHKSEHDVSSTATGIGDRITIAFTRIDMVLKQKVTDYLSVFLNVNNLTNAEDGTNILSRGGVPPEYVGRKLFDQSEKYGITGEFGLTVEF